MLIRFLTRVLARSLSKVLGSENAVYRSAGMEKYSVQVYRDDEIYRNHKNKNCAFLLPDLY